MPLQIKQIYGEFFVKDNDGRVVAGPYLSRRIAARYVRDAPAKNERGNEVETTTKRRCMKCQKTFSSTWIGHRMCSTCRTHSEGLI